MTTRGQNRSNETFAASNSDNGTVLEMLTNNNALQNSSLEERTLADPAIAKDAVKGGKEGPAVAKDQVPDDIRNQNLTVAKEHSKLFKATIKNIMF